MSQPNQTGACWARRVRSIRQQKTITADRTAPHCLPPARPPQKQVWGCGFNFWTPHQTDQSGTRCKIIQHAPLAWTIPIFEGLVAGTCRVWCESWCLSVGRARFFGSGAVCRWWWRPLIVGPRRGVCGFHQ